MRIVRDLPERVRVVRHVWIPMRDGVRLSARIWLPDCSDDAPVPAILEYIPYRKDDHSLPGDEPRHRYWAGHGYASVRVDLRGSGDSEGDPHGRVPGPGAGRRRGRARVARRRSRGARVASA